MTRQAKMTTCAAAAIALVLAACADANGDVEDPGDEAAAAEEAPEEVADEGDAAAAEGGQPDDLPDEWPEELPVHEGVELSRVMVEEMGDGSLLLTVQYRTEEDTGESLAFFESLADHGWDVSAEEGSEGINRFVDARLEGHGWSVSASFENQLYTWSVSEQ